MDFGFNEEQELLRQSARQFLETECSMTYVRKMMEDDRGYSEDQWQQLAGRGWWAMLIPEEYGGMALGMVEMIVALEEMGRVVMPGPFFATTILGGLPIVLAG